MFYSYSNWLTNSNIHELLQKSQIGKRAILALNMCLKLKVNSGGYLVQKKKKVVREELSCYIWLEYDKRYFVAFMVFDFSLKGSVILFQCLTSISEIIYFYFLRSSKRSSSFSKAVSLPCLLDLQHEGVFCSSAFKKWFLKTDQYEWIPRPS